MATSLLTLLDDIAAILDDVALMTKVATKKTAGVLGDDLALNAQQVSGVRADRELPVVWAVAKGSMLNKAILVPVALLISTVAPWAITPLLMIGGLYLCFEGVEKLTHKYLHPADANAEKAHLLESVADESIDLVAMEKSKIKGAIRTDFILSAEIIVISLGTIAAASFGVRVASLVVISLIMTVGVYGLVAGIVKLDDAGLYLSKSAGTSGWSQFKRTSGRAVLWFAPWLMKTLSVVGTAAMFIVGGGILTHGVHWIAERIASTASVATAIPGVGRFIESIATMLLDSLVGIAAGAVVLGVVSLFSRFRGKESNAATH
ncbi:MAG: DUF808 domain-containing protein [Granulosicoccus sp.]